MSWLPVEPLLLVYDHLSAETARFIESLLVDFGPKLRLRAQLANLATPLKQHDILLPLLMSSAGTCP